MKLVHYTDKPLTKIKYREQTDMFKPTGFWISDEDEFGWSDWCNDEEFRVEQLKLSYEIILTNDHNIHIIRTAEEIKWLTKQYYNEKYRWTLNWPAIRKRWDGLIITPYQWSMRLEPDYSWYYRWDCASGCIWNPAAIAGFDTYQKKVVCDAGDLSN